MRQFSHEMRVAAPPAAVLDAFFNAKALGEWWGASSSHCEPRPLGEYVLSWARPAEQDSAGGLGLDIGLERHGELRGTVMEFRPGREFFVAELFWTRDGAPPTGPMALEASCVTRELDTALTIRYSAADDAPGWALHRHELARLVPREMMALKGYLERLFAVYTR
jgi:uncharacterized protein YndB with AHSA1/START domain